MAMKKGILLIFAGLILVSCNLPSKELDIYLCIGQSNMAGRADIDGSVSDTLKNVYLLTLDENQVWEKAANPLNKYSTIRKKLEMQKLGPAYSFAKEIVTLKPGTEIGLVVNAKGGTSINLWHPDSLFFKEAVRRTRIAMEYGQLKGIIWHQGCADARKWKSYTPKLEYMVSKFREELGQENLPFIVGQLSFDMEFRKDFNDMLLDVPKQIKYSAVVSSEGLSTTDNTHFDTKSQVILGQRYAAKMLELLDR